eukprot:s2432_g4.t1
MPVNDRRQTAAKQLTPAAAAKKTECGLGLSSLASDFYVVVEEQARGLCTALLEILQTGQAAAPPGSHVGAARLRLAFAGVWELQEAALLRALRCLLRGERRAAWATLAGLGSAAEAAERRLSSEIAYTESRRAFAKRGPVRRAAQGPGGLGAGVSLSLALATFAQGFKKRQEVLQSPEAYNVWLQELIGRLETHLAELGEPGPPPKSGSGADKGSGAEDGEALRETALAPDEVQLLAAAGYTVVHEALGRSRPANAFAGPAGELTQEDERQLRRESRQAWKSCVEELQGGAARLWQKRLASSEKIARFGDLPEEEGEGYQAWGEAPILEGKSPSRRSWRPSQAQHELMQALQFQLSDDAAKLDGLSDVQLVLRRVSTAASQWEFAEALLGACTEGNIEEARMLLEAGADVNSFEQSNRVGLGQTPLIRACQGGHLGLARMLLEAGAKKEFRGDDGVTALMWACYEGHIEVGRLLVESGADLNSTDDNGFTNLSQACTRGDMEVARWLLEAGADVNRVDVDADGLTVLARACEGGHIEVACMLLEAGADVNRFDDDGRTALIRACEKGHLGAARILLGARADVNRTADADDVTPLIAACRGDNVEIARMLLQAGADKESQIIALMGASERGNIMITSVLLEAAADINRIDEAGRTALLRACEGGHIEVARTLLGAGANKDLQTHDGYTALMSACYLENIEVARMLLEAGASKDLQTHDGYTALVNACRLGHFEVARMLLEAAADMNVADQFGDTALVCAQDRGHLAIVQLLTGSRCK